MQALWWHGILCLMSQVKVFHLPFIKKELVQSDVYSYFFELKNTDFTFQPGQYIQMNLPHPDPDDRGSWRFFTITSSPTEKDYLMITCRKGKSSFKRALFALTPGTSVQFYGPIGKFVLEEITSI